MRLIDADKLIEKVFIADDNWNPVVTLEDIEELPTAYDIDKVVEQLEERKVKHEELCQYGDSHHLAVDVLVRAIEIVKGGVE